MADWSEDERLMLDALQAEDSPTSEDAARMKRRLLVGISAGAVGVSAAGLLRAASSEAAVAHVSGGKAVASAGLGAFVSGAGLKWITASAIVAGAFASVYTWSVFESRSAFEPGKVASGDVPVAAVVPLGSASRVEPDPKAEVEAEASPPSAEEPSSSDSKKGRIATRPRGKASVKEGMAAGESSLKQEAALLGRAQAALQSGDTREAISALMQHQKEYPRGLLSGEREAALAIALCQSGDLVRGQKQAQRFLSKSSESPMVQRLRATCKLP